MHLTSKALHPRPEGTPTGIQIAKELRLKVAQTSEPLARIFTAGLDPRGVILKKGKA